MRKYSHSFWSCCGGRVKASPSSLLTPPFTSSSVSSPEHVTVMLHVFMAIQLRLKPMSRIRDVYPGFWLLSIPDPTTATKERGEKLVVLPCCSHKYHKIERVKYQNLTQFTQENVTMRSKIWVWNPGPGKTYSGSRFKRAPDPGSATTLAEMKCQQESTTSRKNPKRGAQHHHPHDYFMALCAYFSGGGGGGSPG